MKARIKAALRLLSLAVMMAVPLLKSQRSAAAEPVTIDFWIFQDFLAGDAGGSAILKSKKTPFYN
jgi:hypothetical protein